MKKAFSILSCALALVALTGAGASAQGPAAPKNWPWRSITLQSSDGKAEDVKTIAQDLKANAIRIDLIPRHAARKFGCSVDEAWERELSWASKVLDACGQYDVVGIISYYTYPDDPESEYKQGSERFWESPSDIDGFVANVDKILNRFKDRGGELGAYYFMIEPVEYVRGKAIVPPGWPALARRIVGSVRRIDGDRYVVISSGPGSTNAGYKTMQPIDDPYVIYSTHMYQPHAYTHQGVGEKRQGFKTYEYPGRVNAKYWDKAALEKYMKPVMDFQDKHGVRVWIGEFSATRWAPGSLRYIEDCIDMFQGHGWGWNYFTFSGWHGWNPHYNDQYSSDADRAKHLSPGPTERWKLLQRKYSEPYPN